MKSKIKILSLILCVAIMFAPLLMGAGKVYASSYTLADSGTVNYGNSISSADIADAALYSRLSYWASRLSRGALREFTFSSGVDTLDLSGGNTDTKIKSLSGLRKLDLTGVKVVRLSNNDLETLTSDVFGLMPNLQALYLDNCNLKSVDLTGVETLRYLNLNNNNITTIKLNKMPVDNSVSYVQDSNVVAIGGTMGSNITWEQTLSTTTQINLSNNSISDLTNIKFPEDKMSCVVDVYNNAIAKNETSFEHIQLNIGLQSLSASKMKTETIDDASVYYVSMGTKFYFEPVNDDKLSFELSWTYTENGEEHNDSMSINNTTFTQPQNFNLSCGSYEFNVYYEGVDIATYISEHSSDLQAKIWHKIYTDVVFNVKPSSPSYMYVVGGVEYPELMHIDKVTTINFSADEGADIYYRFSTTDKWTKANSVIISKGGTQLLYYKAVYGDYESDVRQISLNAAPSLRVPSILILFLFVVGILIIGFVVAPLLRRFVIKE